MSGADARVGAVVDNWLPRFLANGIDYFDLRRILDGIQGWDTWADRWAASAEEYERLGDDALAAGYRVTAAEHLRRAALTLHFAQFVLTDDPPRRSALQRRMAATYARCAPLLDPPAVRITVPYRAGGAGVSAVGYLRVPARTHRPGLVVLLPGLESTKEQFSTYEPYFLRRGIATLSFEGPGQGEAGWAAAFRDQTYAEAVRAVGQAIVGLDDVDPTRVVALGTSFGGYLALRHGRELPGLRAVVDIAGPYDLRDFDALQEVTREGFREFVGASDLGEARHLLGDVTLDGTLASAGAPVLVVHGEQDTIIDVAHAHRIAAALGDRATVWLETDGNHSCNNLATKIRPAVADWVMRHLEETE